MEQDRRNFLQQLVAGGATVRHTRKRVPRAHANDIRLYHGPMTIPPHVAGAVREDPTPHRATGRGTHLVSRYADADGTVWLFRCQIPTHRGMVGEIVQSPIGRRIRVHCWSAATPGEYRTPEEITAREAAPAIPMTAAPPPLAVDPPEWMLREAGCTDEEIVAALRCGEVIADFRATS
jgi:hypothetical protein